MNSELEVTFGNDFKNKPLATVNGLPGGFADITPARLRSLSRALNQIADDVERGCCFDKRYGY